MPLFYYVHGVILIVNFVYHLAGVSRHESQKMLRSMDMRTAGNVRGLLILCSYYHRPT
jgi:hypothetical protein